MMAQSDYNLLNEGISGAPVFQNIDEAIQALRSKNSGPNAPTLAVDGEEFLLKPEPADGFWYCYQWFGVTLGWVERWRVNTATGEVTLAGVADNAWQSVWHPWNMLAENDGATGEIWRFAANGAVALVTTPDFVDGWEYAFSFENIQSTAGTASNTTLRCNLFRETSGAYAGAGRISEVPISVAEIGNCFFELLAPRKARRTHLGASIGGYGSATNQAANSGALNYSYWVAHAAAQKITRAQFSASAGNLTGSGTAGRIIMLKRKDSKP